jgi:hypothetical protein
MQLGEEHDQQSDQTHEGASSIKYKRKVPDFCTRQYESQQPEVQEHNQLQPQPRIERDISRLREEEAIKQARQTFVMEVCKSVGKSMGGSSWGVTLGAGFGAYLSGISDGQYHIRPNIESRRRIIKTLGKQGGKRIIGEYVGNTLIAALGAHRKGQLGEVLSILSKAVMTAGGVYAATRYGDEISDTIGACWRILHQQLNPAPEHIKRDTSRLRKEAAIKQACQTFVMEVCKSVGKSMGGPSWGGTLGAGLGAYFNGISVRDTIPVDSTNVSTSIKHIHLIMWLYHILRPSVESRRRIIKTLSNQGVKNISREYVGNAVIAALGTRGKGRLGKVISILSKSTIAAGGAYATTCYSDEIGNTIEAYWRIVQNWQKKG